MPRRRVKGRMELKPSAPPKPHVPPEQPPAPPASVELPGPAPASHPASAPQLAPVPTLDTPEVPPYVPFSYEGVQPLTPADRDVITTFHASYMQGEGLAGEMQRLSHTDRQRRLRQVKMEAEYVLPLMQKQYTEACRGPDGPASQEALQVQKNIAWVEQVLAL